MKALELYGQIQEYLDFKEEIRALYKAILLQVLQSESQQVIDIGCGQGEFCNILELNGVKTLGVDLSKKQIELAKLNFPELEFKAIDIADINEQFECATATFDVINYISEKNLKEFFTNTNQILKDGGYFIFDINTLFGFEEIAQGALLIDKEDIFIGIDAKFNGHSLFTELTVFTKEDHNYNKQTGTIEQFYHSNKLLESTLKDAGFEIIKSIDFSLHSDEENDKIILVCKKL